MEYKDITEGMLLEVRFHAYPGDNRVEIVEVEEIADDPFMGVGFWCKERGFLPKNTLGRFWSIIGEIKK